MIEKLSTIFKGLFSQSETKIVIKVNEIIDYLNRTSVEGSYKVYTALLTQTGTDAPIATVLQNDFDIDIVYSFSATGQFIGTITGKLIDNKTSIKISSSNNSGEILAYRLDVDSFEIDTLTFLGVGVNDILFNNTIEIRVYN